MTSIRTKYLAPTDRRGARIKADAGLGRTTTIAYRYDLDHEGRHDAAALALCRKFKWTGRLARGGTENGCAYVFLTDEDADVVTIPLDTTHEA